MGRAVSNVGRGISRAFGGNRNLAAAIGIVAAIAIPIAAPAIATAMIGSAAVAGAATFAATSAAVGAGLGAAAGLAAGSLTGTQGTSALLGGLGGGVGGFIGGNGVDVARGALFGPSSTSAANVTAAGYQGAEAFGPAAGYQGATGPAFGTAEAITPGVVISPGGMEGVTAGGVGAPIPAEGIGGAVSAPAPPAGASPAYTAPGPTGAVSAPAGGAGGTGMGGAAAPTGTRVERFFGGLTGGGTKMDLTTAEGVGRSLSGLASPAGLASVGQLAMTMYNKPPEGLTAQERAFVDETASLAGTNRELFDSRVREARRLLQQGTPNPEQAFGQANLALQRRIREAGLRSPEDVRRALIEGTRIGAASIPAEYARAAGATQAGLSAMPTTAPAGAASLALPAYRDAERRQREYEAGLARGIGGLAGALGGNRKGLFA